MTSIVLTDRVETTYNITVADYHTYYVSEFDVWVHNVCQLGHHGNSKLSSDDQHNYIIYDKDGNALKTGVGNDLGNNPNVASGSVRADSQLDKDAGEYAVVVDRHPGGIHAEGNRQKALDREQELTNELFDAGHTMTNHQRPKYQPPGYR